MSATDVLSADDAQLVSATCSLVAKPGKDVQALPAPLPADNAAALTIVGEEQGDVHASDRAPAPETGTAARGATELPASKADDVGSEDEDDEEDDSDDEDDDEEVEAGATGRISAAAPEPAATARGQRSEENAAAQAANGRGAAAAEPAAAEAAMVSSSEDEDEDDDHEGHDDEVEDEARGGMTAAEGQHAAAAATDGPSNIMQPASRVEPGPAPAQSSDDDDHSSDDADTSDSDDDGNRPHVATNGMQRQSAIASQRGSDAAHKSYGAVPAAPAGRAASSKRRAPAVESQAPAEPAKVRQVDFLSLDPSLACTLVTATHTGAVLAFAQQMCNHPRQTDEFS